MRLVVIHSNVVFAEQIFGKGEIGEETHLSISVHEALSWHSGLVNLCPFLPLATESRNDESISMVI